MHEEDVMTQSRRSRARPSGRVTALALLAAVPARARRLPWHGVPWDLAHQMVPDSALMGIRRRLSISRSA